MDKKLKITSFKNDLKILSTVLFFYVLCFLLIIIYQYYFLNGLNTDFTKLMIPMFVLFIVGFLFFVNILYMEIIETDSSELILSLPIGNFYFFFIRTIRLYIFYCILIFCMYSLFYFTTTKNEFNGEFIDITLIMGGTLFISSLGVFLMFIGRHLAWGFGFPLFIIFFSYFYRGSGLLYWHICQWIKPKPDFYDIWKFEISFWISGFTLLILASFVLDKKEYLIR